MTEDREKTEQAELNARVKRWMETAKGIGYGAWGVAAMLCAMVGFMGYVATKGSFGDLLIIVGVVGLVKLFKVEG